MIPKRRWSIFPEENQIINHRPDCTECDEILRINKEAMAFKKPSCAFIRGLLKGIGDCFEKELSVTVMEEKCRLVGDPQCQYRISYELKQR